MPTIVFPIDFPLRDRLVVVMGGGGFVGRHLAEALLKEGARLRLVGRQIERAFAVRALAKLGQVQFTRGDVADHARLPALVQGADAVVNLVGAFAGNLDALQGKGLAALAQAAQAAGVRRLVHVSAVGADAASPVAYARTKAEGEAAIQSGFPIATIIRPSVLFGEDDRFINLFASLVGFPVLPVFGPDARLAPLNVDDAAAAITAALARADTPGKTYEIGGPEVLTMMEINRCVARAACRRPWLVPLPDSLSGFIAAIPGGPISRDQWRLLQAGNVPSGTLPGLADLGIVARPLGLFLDRWLVRYRRQGRFGGLPA